jgi:hypothetical protein
LVCENSLILRESRKSQKCLISLKLSFQHEVTGAEDLKSVFELKLKVLSSELSLSKLHLYVPQLMILDLSGSYLHSLRLVYIRLGQIKSSSLEKPDL